MDDGYFKTLQIRAVSMCVYVTTVKHQLVLKLYNHKIYIYIYTHTHTHTRKTTLNWIWIAYAVLKLCHAWPSH